MFALERDSRGQMNLLCSYQSMLIECEWRKMQSDLHNNINIDYEQSVDIVVVVIIRKLITTHEKKKNTNRLLKD